MAAWMRKAWGAQRPDSATMIHPSPKAQSKGGFII
jgi:hypothetical protein